MGMAKLSQERIQLESPVKLALDHAVVAPAEAPRQKPNRLEAIEGMRAIAAIYVVVGHIAALVDWSNLAGTPSFSPLWLQRILDFFGQGRLAVAAFIVISGFCLRYAARSRKDLAVVDVGGFLARRCKRILPPYYACLVISLLVALFISPIPGRMPFTQYLPVTWSNFLAHVLLIHNWRPDTMYKINGVLWSIAIEFQLYLLFPWIARMWRKVGFLGVLAATIVLSLAVDHMIHRGAKLYPWYSCYFVFGMFAADLASRFKCRGAGGVGAVSLAAGVVLVIKDSPAIVAECAVAFAAAMWCIAAVSHQTGFNRILANGLSWRPIATVGAFSYSLYLMHHPILQTLDVFGPHLVNRPVVHFFFLLVVGLPVAIGGAFAFSLVFEGSYVRKALAAAKSAASAPSVVNPVTS